VKKEVNDLLAFMTEHNDSFYEHQGKDFARSLRALVASVVKLVDPEAALEI
jgi:membrane carboxypeptidase/penicillin-binding protein